MIYETMHGAFGAVVSFISMIDSSNVFQSFFMK